MFSAMRFSKGHLGTILFAAGSVLVACELDGQEWPTDAWQSEIEAARQAIGIPGLAAVVVVGEETPLLRGYGVRRVGEPDPVTPQTIFQIASLTKAVTATAAALLVDEGLLDWDDPIQLHLPDFRLQDPWVSSHLTLRDAMSLRGGIPGGDSIALFAPRSRREILDAAADLEAPLFRATYGASPNLMFFLAGEAVAAAAGMSWDEFVARRLFEPLGMNSTTTMYDRGTGEPNYGWPHVRADDRIVPRSERPRADNVAAAAGTFSNVVDWEKWVRFLLSDGAVGGQRLVDQAVLAETFAPTSILTPAYQGSFNPNALLNAYGLGWVLSEYRGRTLIEHAGALPGSSAVIALIPEEDVGIVLVTNLDFGVTRAGLVDLKFEILDSILDRQRVTR